MKVYELAKKMNVNSKDVLAVATNLGISVKTHMSVLEEKDIKKIEKNLKSSSKTEKTKTVKKDNPVIVRRVISNEDTVVEEKTKQNNEKTRKNVGFVERNQKKDFNIVYRNKQQKPPTVSELFGLEKKKNDKKDENVASKEKDVKKLENIEKTEKVEVKKTEKVVKENKVENIEDKGAKKAEVKSENLKSEAKQDMRENRTESQERRTNNTERPIRNNNRNGFDRNNSDRNGNDRNNNMRRNSNPSERNNSRNFDRRNNNSGYRNSDNNNGYRNNDNNNGYRNNDNNNGYRNNNFRNDRDRNNDNGYGNRRPVNNNRPFDRNNDNGNNNGYRNNRNGNFENRNNNYDNRNGNRGNFDNRNRNYDNRNRNNDNNGYRNGKRVLDEKEIDKTIKNIMEIETIAEKETSRDYSKSIDKQRNNKISNSRYDDSKNTRNKKSRNNERFDEDKLKSLKQENKLSKMFNDQEGGMLDYYDLTTVRGKRNRKKNNQINDKDRVKQKIFKLTEITIPETITVKDFAAEMKKTTAEVIKKLLGYGVMATINNDIDFDTATLIAEEFGIKTHLKETVTDEEKLFDDTEDDEKDLMPRPPVIVVMGHVDHGKTSLLDAVRSTNVIKGEAGGITQHIGAYKVKLNGREITFLDTPGHEAFTSMRARGAQVTDIAILVVAANDGVMPQTVEAINHAKAAGIPIIVAVNKMDLPGANIERVKEQLTKYELIPEEWGGDTIYVPISAKEHTNIDTLLEMVLLVADMKELKANPNKQAKGVVIEAKLDKTKGPIATMLVQRGTLDVGDTIVVGSVIGRIRAMINDKGKKVKKAGPSTPVEISGLTEVPSAGDTFYEVEDEKTAKHLIEKRKRQEREKSINATAKVSLNDLFSQIAKGKLKQLNLIVKADVQGSVEAVQQSLEKLSNDEVQVKVIHANVGGITESDVTLAKVSNAIIIGFNVRPEVTARDMAAKDEVEIKLYSVIYQAIEDVQMAMLGMLDPEFEEKVIGTATVRQTFKVSNVGTIAGCYVTDGKIQRNAGVRVIRENVVLHDGKLVSLKRFKDDVKEVGKGFECGIQIENYNDIKEEDTIEVYVMEEVKRKLKDLKKDSKKEDKKED